jgi:polyhydroxybutyrate depolymerase
MGRVSPALVGRAEEMAVLADALAAACAGGHAPVVLYRIEGGGHGWPGGPQFLPARVVGPIPRHRRPHPPPSGHDQHPAGHGSSPN